MPLAKGTVRGVGCQGPGGTSRSSAKRHSTEAPPLKWRKSRTVGLRSMPAPPFRLDKGTALPKTSGQWSTSKGPLGSQALRVLAVGLALRAQMSSKFRNARIIGTLLYLGKNTRGSRFIFIFFSGTEANACKWPHALGGACSKEKLLQAAHMVRPGALKPWIKLPSMSELLSKSTASQPGSQMVTFELARPRGAFEVEL